MGEGFDIWVVGGGEEVTEEKVNVFFSKVYPSFYYLSASNAKNQIYTRRRPPH
jgi:hypothetical protein